MNLWILKDYKSDGTLAIANFNDFFMQSLDNRHIIIMRVTC